VAPVEKFTDNTDKLPKTHKYHDSVYSEQAIHYTLSSFDLTLTSFNEFESFSKGAPRKLYLNH